MSVASLQNIPTLKYLPLVYRSILTITKRHGLHTLARIHHYFYKNGEIITLPYGCSLFIPGDPHYFGYTSGVHERHIRDAILNSLNEGDICVDVGANIGYFSAYMAGRVGQNGAVYAFEPIQETYEILSLNAKLAQGSSFNIFPFCEAVSANDGELSITRKEHSTLHQVSTLAEDPDKDLERTNAVTMALALNRIGYDGPIALVKIDVEGHELAVIEGALPLLMNGRIQRMIVEVEPGDSAERIEKILHEIRGTLKTWINGRWCQIGMNELPYRTDILVEFD